MDDVRPRQREPHKFVRSPIEEQQDLIGYLLAEVDRLWERIGELSAAPAPPAPEPAEPEPDPEPIPYDRLNEKIPADMEDLAEPGEDWAALRARLIAELNQLRQYMFLGAINQVPGGKDRLDLLEHKNAEHKWMDD